MISRLDEAFSFFQKAIELRGVRQQVLASNIANADTPNYKARDFNFAAELKGAFSRNPGMLEVTDARHMQPASGSLGVKLQYSMPYQASLDGNTVEMDVERNKYVDNAVRYEADLTVLTNKIKTMISAIQG
ncbi:MAG TPA: flagellar basal body rod protein FlgB [Burkholderiales bacterium]|nr:flagellar basal body rod protein FlgB [Burkholderiales bacterium]